ncbi:hypothetical protein EMCRGX_G016290 [Ephydatia muelleri]
MEFLSRDSVLAHAGESYVSVTGHRIDRQVATPSGLVLWKLVSAVLAVKVDKESYTAENIAARLKDCANEHSVAITVIEDDHTPNLDDLMNDVAVISAKWRLVGVQLKLPNGTLDEIQAQNAGRPDVC